MANTTSLRPLGGPPAPRRETPGQGVGRTARTHHYLMCRPTYFTVEYAINPWMAPDIPVDRELALAQWENLRGTYERLGHRISLIEPERGLPDMVFAANGAFTVDGLVYGARFRYAERAAESEAYLSWFAANGFGRLHRPTATVEGEGDLLLAGDRILAGTGFRTDKGAHAELAQLTGLEVVTLELVDPRYYHLDTALTVLSDAPSAEGVEGVEGPVVAYLPMAFSQGSRETLRRLYPDAILADPEDAEVFGLNAVSDGRNVVLPEQAAGLAGQLEAYGFHPVPVDLSELRKAGGGPKCCTLEVRR